MANRARLAAEGKEGRRQSGRAAPPGPRVGPGAPIPAWLHTFGGVGETSAGQTRSVVVLLNPGTCQWFSGTAPEQEEAQPQHKRGGVGSLEVTSDATGAQLPTTAAQITAQELAPDDYRFEASGLKAGTNQITFSNGGGQLRSGGPPRVSKAKMIQEVKVP